MEKKIKIIEELFKNRKAKTEDAMNQSLTDEKILTSDAHLLAKMVCDKSQISYEVEVNLDNNSNNKPQNDVAISENNTTYINHNTIPRHNIVTYYYAIKGKKELLQFAPQQNRVMENYYERWMENATDGNNLVITVCQEDAENELKRRKAKLQTILEQLKKECDEFDRKLFDFTLSFIRAQKERSIKEKEQSEKFNF